MTEQLDTTAWQSPHWVLLPSRAYLLSVRDQTLPTREAALEDAKAHFEEAAESDDPGWRDMALLGLIAETMQILEDLAYLAEAYEKPALPGLPRYVPATVYSGIVPTNFYNGIKNWSDERFEILAGYRFLEPESDRTIGVPEALGITDQIDDADHKAIREAEQATVTLMRADLQGLARTWEQFGRYFQAFKHGGLALNRDDFTGPGDNGEEREPSISVWLRKKEQGEIWGDTNLRPDEVARDAAVRGGRALDLCRFVIKARLRSVEMVEFDDQGEIVGIGEMTSPWDFRLRRDEISADAVERIERRLNLTFV